MPVQRKPARSGRATRITLPASSLPAGAVVPIPDDRLMPLPDLKPKDLAAALAGIDFTVPVEKPNVPSVVTLNVRMPYSPYVGGLEFAGVPNVNAVGTTVDYPGYNNPLFGQHTELLGLWLRSGTLYVIEFAVQSKKAGTYFHISKLDGNVEDVEATGNTQYIIRGFDLRQMGTGYLSRLVLNHNGKKRSAAGEPKPFTFFSCRATLVV